MTIKKGDFIELDYTAYLLDDNAVFDTTNPDNAEKAGMICDHDHDHEHGHHHVTKDDFKPIIICVGENHVLPGLDEQLIGLNLGKHDIILGEENAFGKKDPKLLKLMPLNAFKKQKVNPFPGLTVDMDGTRGVVRSVSGGRVIVDFNHPLSGKTVKYDVNLLKKIDDSKEKLVAMLDMVRVPVEDVSLEKDTATVKIPVEIPESFLEQLKNDLERICGLKIVFSIKKSENSEKNLSSKSSDSKKEEKEKVLDVKEVNVDSDKEVESEK